MKHIDTYKTIYEVDIVVANKEVTTKDLQKSYTYIDGTELVEDDSNPIAYTSRLINKHTNKCTVLIKYCRDNDVKGIDKRIDFINTVAHEATHAAMDIYSKIGEKVFVDDSNELLSYLIGWISECIYKTWTKK